MLKSFLGPLGKCFIGAFEKMLRNGYQDGDLADAPGSWENVVCKRIKQVMTCE